MTDLQIRREAVEAAAYALRGIYPNEFADDFYFQQQAKAVIAEFCRVEGLTVEKNTRRPRVPRHQGPLGPSKQRLVGKWRDVGEER